MLWRYDKLSASLNNFQIIIYQIYSSFSSLALCLLKFNFVYDWDYDNGGNDINEIEEETYENIFDYYYEASSFVWFYILL